MFFERLIRLFLDFCTFIVGLFYRTKKYTLPPIKDKLLLMNINELEEKIKSGKITCEDVYNSYWKRCNDVQPLINAIVQDNFRHAFEKAKKIDHRIRTTGRDDIEGQNAIKNLKLLGIPFTTKFSIGVQSMPFDSGMVMRKGLKAPDDSTVIKNMKKAGAVLTAVTNIPEMSVWWETYNPVHGRTKNPYDLSRIVGGSSGGEAALVAAAGSLFGIGNDLGGSIRLPSLFCGVFGHMTTPGVIKSDVTFPDPKAWLDYMSIGPICRYSADIAPALKAMAGDDAALLKLDEKVDLSKITIFYLIDDSGNPIANRICIEVREAITTAVKYFRTKFGTEDHEFKLNKDVFKISQLWQIAINKNNPEYTLSQMRKGKSDLNPYFEFVKALFNQSQFSVPLILFALSEKFSETNPDSEKGKQLIAELNEFRVTLLNILGNDGVLFCPLYTSSAVKHTTTIFNTLNLAYSWMVNMIKFPATQCPTGFDDNDLPIGFQVITTPYNDRLSIAVACELEKLFGGWVDPSAPTKTSSSYFS